MGDTLLHHQAIHGGHIYWQDDVKTINDLAEHLRDTNDMLGERYDLLKAEVELKERRLQAEEKSRLYDRIAQEIAPQLNKADELLQQSSEQPEKANALLSQVCVISAYIKRRANLIASPTLQPLQVRCSLLTSRLTPRTRPSQAA